MRKKLIEALSTFQGIFMVTLTLDQTIFDGDPSRAFDYVKGKEGSGNSQHLIGELVRTLKKRGYLHTPRFFCVLECQKNGFPHWHLLLDASFIPIEAIRNRWDSFRPKDAGPVQGNRPAFGAVRFSAPKFADHKHAAHYACKYLIKNPEQGFPDWLLDSSRVHRFTTSKGLFPTDRESVSKEASDETAIDLHESLAQLASESDAFEFSKSDDVLEPEELIAFPPEPSTVRYRIAKCKSRCVLLKVYRIERDGVIEEKRSFVSKLDVSLSDLKAFLGRTESGNGVPLSADEADRLRREFGSATIEKSEPYRQLERLIEAVDAGDFDDDDADAFIRCWDYWNEPSPEPTGEDPPLQAGGTPAGRQTALACPLCRTDESDEASQAGEAGRKGPAGVPSGGGGEASDRRSPHSGSLDSIDAFHAHLRDEHGVTGDPAWDLQNEAIDDLGDDVSRHRWARAVDEALANLLFDEAADSQEKGEAA